MSSQLDHTTHKAEEFKFPISIFAHRLKSPYNVGGLFRLADALGVEMIYLSEHTPSPPNRKIAKTARSTDKFVPYQTVKDSLGFLVQLKQEGHLLVALELCDNSIDIESMALKLDSKICLILGEENNGVEQEILDLVDLVCHIPMRGQNSSMNVVSACAIALNTITNKINNDRLKK